MLDTDVMIDSHHENVSFKGAVGTKQALRKMSPQGYVPAHKPNNNNPSPHGACTHRIGIIEGHARSLDSTGNAGGEHEPIHIQPQRHNSDWSLAMLPQGFTSRRAQILSMQFGFTNKKVMVTTRTSNK